MLQTIRDRTHGWIAGIIITLLIIAFAMWGISSYLNSNGPNNVVAKVNGEDITKQQLAMVIAPLQNQAQAANGGILSLQEQDKIRRQALDLLLNIQVLKQASIRDHYKVSQQQVENFIRQIPQFQVAGQFSPERLQQILNANMISPNQFLDSIGSTLLIDQPRLGIILSSFALPDEIQTTIALVNQQRDIKYLTISKAPYIKDVKVTPEEIQSYYDQHKSNFKTPEEVSIEYIKLSLDDLMKTIPVSDDAVKKAYDENQSTYTSTKDHTVQPFDQVKDKIKENLQREKAQEIFADTREKLSNVTYENPTTLSSASKSLSLPIYQTGLFSKDQGDAKAGKDDITQNKKVRAVAFSPDVLTSQNNSDVIQLSADTAIVLRVKEHKAASVMPLSDVEKQISDQLQISKAEDQAKAVARQISSELANGSSSQQIADKYHVVWTDAGFVGRYDPLINSAILFAAFKLPKNATAEKNLFTNVKVPDGYAVIAVSGVKDGVQDANQQQSEAFVDQIQNSFGSVEYLLYEKSIMKKAKIVNYANQAG